MKNLNSEIEYTKYNSKVFLYKEDTHIESNNLTSNTKENKNLDILNNSYCFRGELLFNTSSNILFLKEYENNYNLNIGYMKELKSFLGTSAEMLLKIPFLRVFEKLKDKCYCNNQDRYELKNDERKDLIEDDQNNGCDYCFKLKINNESKYLFKVLFTLFPDIKIKEISNDSITNDSIDKIKEIEDLNYINAFKNDLSTSISSHMSNSSFLLQQEEEVNEDIEYNNISEEENTINSNIIVIFPRNTNTSSLNLNSHLNHFFFKINLSIFISYDSEIYNFAKLIKNIETFNIKRKFKYIERRNEIYKDKIEAPKEYQLELFKKAKESNSIIFLETGMGKTYIAILLANYYLDKRSKINKTRNNKVVFLFKNINLLLQQSRVIKANSEYKVVSIFGGENLNSVARFKKKLERYGIICSTPELFYKILTFGFVDPGEIDLIVLDECHHCKGGDFYYLILKQFIRQETRILGLTASPCAIKTTSIEKITNSVRDLCTNLRASLIYSKESSTVIKETFELKKDDIEDNKNDKNNDTIINKDEKDDNDKKEVLAKPSLSSTKQYIYVKIKELTYSFNQEYQEIKLLEIKVNNNNRENIIEVNQSNSNKLNLDITKISSLSSTKTLINNLKLRLFHYIKAFSDDHIKKTTQTTTILSQIERVQTLFSLSLFSILFAKEESIPEKINGIFSEKEVKVYQYITNSQTSSYLSSLLSKYEENYESSDICFLLEEFDDKEIGDKNKNKLNTVLNCSKEMFSINKLVSNNKQLGIIRNCIKKINLLLKYCDLETMLEELHFDIIDIQEMFKMNFKGKEQNLEGMADEINRFLLFFKSESNIKRFDELRKNYNCTNDIKDNTENIGNSNNDDISFFNKNICEIFEKYNSEMLDYNKLSYFDIKMIQYRSSYLDNIISIIKNDFKNTGNKKTIIFTTERLLAVQLSSTLTKYLNYNNEKKDKIPYILGISNTETIYKHISSEALSTKFSEKDLVKNIERFRNKENILIATSIAEEGLDIPQCSRVISLNLIITMKELVQKAGRARMSEAEMYLFHVCSEKEYKDYIAALIQNMMTIKDLIDNDSEIIHPKIIHTKIVRYYEYEDHMNYLKKLKEINDTLANEGNEVVTDLISKETYDVDNDIEKSDSKVISSNDNEKNSETNYINTDENNNTNTTNIITNNENNKDPNIALPEKSKKKKKKKKKAVNPNTIAKADLEDNKIKTNCNISKRQEFLTKTTYIEGIDFITSPYLEQLRDSENKAKIENYKKYFQLNQDRNINKEIINIQQLHVYNELLNNLYKDIKNIPSISVNNVISNEDTYAKVYKNYAKSIINEFSLSLSNDGYSYLRVDSKIDKRLIEIAENIENNDSTININLDKIIDIDNKDVKKNKSFRYFPYLSLSTLLGKDLLVIEEDSISDIGFKTEKEAKEYFNQYEDEYYFIALKKLYYYNYFDKNMLYKKNTEGLIDLSSYTGTIDGETQLEFIAEKIISDKNNIETNITNTNTNMNDNKQESNNINNKTYTYFLTTLDTHPNYIDFNFETTIDEKDKSNRQIIGFLSEFEIPPSNFEINLPIKSLKQLFYFNQKYDNEGYYIDHESKERVNKNFLEKNKLPTDSNKASLFALLNFFHSRKGFNDSNTQLPILITLSEIQNKKMMFFYYYSLFSCSDSELKFFLLIYLKKFEFFDLFDDCLSELSSMFGDTEEEKKKLYELFSLDTIEINNLKSMLKYVILLPNIPSDNTNTSKSKVKSNVKVNNSSNNNDNIKLDSKDINLKLNLSFSEDSYAPCFKIDYNFIDKLIAQTKSLIKAYYLFINYNMFTNNNILIKQLLKFNNDKRDFGFNSEYLKELNYMIEANSTLSIQKEDSQSENKDEIIECKKKMRKELINQIINNNKNSKNSENNDDTVTNQPLKSSLFKSEKMMSFLKYFKDNFNRNKDIRDGKLFINLLNFSKVVTLSQTYNEDVRANTKFEIKDLVRNRYLIKKYEDRYNEKISLQKMNQITKDFRTKSNQKGKREFTYQEYFLDRYDCFVDNRLGLKTCFVVDFHNELSNVRFWRKILSNSNNYSENVNGVINNISTTASCNCSCNSNTSSNKEADINKICTCNCHSIDSNTYKNDNSIVYSGIQTTLPVKKKNKYYLSGKLYTKLKPLIRLPKDCLFRLNELSLDQLHLFTILPIISSLVYNYFIYYYEFKCLRSQFTAFKRLNELNISHFKKAITTKSADYYNNYEVFEFLGDSILKFLSSFEVFVKYPYANKDLLTSKRRVIESNKTLFFRAKEFYLEKHLKTSKFSFKKINIPGLTRSEIDFVLNVQANRKLNKTVLKKLKGTSEANKEEREYSDSLKTVEDFAKYYNMKNIGEKKLIKDDILKKQEEISADGLMNNKKKLDLEISEGIKNKIAKKNNNNDDSNSSKIANKTDNAIISNNKNSSVNINSNSSGSDTKTKLKPETETDFDILQEKEDIESQSQLALKPIVEYIKYKKLVQEAFKLEDNKENFGNKLPGKSVDVEVENLKEAKEETRFIHQISSSSNINLSIDNICNRIYEKEREKKNRPCSQKTLSDMVEALVGFLFKPFNKIDIDSSLDNCCLFLEELGVLEGTGKILSDFNELLKCSSNVEVVEKNFSKNSNKITKLGSIANDLKKLMPRINNVNNNYNNITNDTNIKNFNLKYFPDSFYLNNLSNLNIYNTNLLNNKVKLVTEQLKENKIDKKLPYTFDNPSNILLLIQATTHNTCISNYNLNKNTVLVNSSYNRLSFLGEALYSFILSYYLINKYQFISEELLHILRINGLNHNLISIFALELRLDELLDSNDYCDIYETNSKGDTILRKGPKLNDDIMNYKKCYFGLMKEKKFCTKFNSEAEYNDVICNDEKLKQFKKQKEDGYLELDNYFVSVLNDLFFSYIATILIDNKDINVVYYKIMEFIKPYLLANCSLKTYDEHPKSKIYYLFLKYKEYLVSIKEK